MLPEIRFGGVTLSSYWLMFGVGVVAMLVLMLIRKHRFGLSTGKAVAFTLALTVCGVASVKLLFIIENLRDVLEYGLTAGGMSFFGAVFLVPVLMYPVGRLLSLRFGQTADACALCVLAMIGCMRVGCFLVGCCGGTETTICSLTFQWPTQAVESIGDFAILATLYDYEVRNAYAGRLYPWFMIDYSVMRFVIEFFRATPKDWLGMSHGQWFAVFALMIGWIWLVSGNKKASTDKNESSKKQ